VADRPPDLAWFWPGVLWGALLALLIVAVPPGRVVTHDPDLIIAGCLAVGLLVAALHPPTRRRWLAAYLREES